MNEPTQSAIMLVIAGMAIVNFALRHVPLAVLSRVELPKPLLRWLSYVPVSVMGALVASEVFRPHGAWQPPLTNPGVYAAALTALVFHFTRSFLGATITGVICFLILRGLI